MRIAANFSACFYTNLTNHLKIFCLSTNHTKALKVLNLVLLNNSVLFSLCKWYVEARLITLGRLISKVIENLKKKKQMQLCYENYNKEF